MNCHHRIISRIYKGYGGQARFCLVCEMCGLTLKQIKCKEGVDLGKEPCLNCGDCFSKGLIKTDYSDRDLLKDVEDLDEKIKAVRLKYGLTLE